MATQVKNLPAISSRQKKFTRHKEAEKHFAAGFNFYKLFWVFVLGSIIGCAVETIFVLVLRGGYECRASLIYGPFNIIYGIGALTLYVGLYKINRNKKHHIFIFGAVAGTIVEFISSWVQEMAFGTVSWDYSHLPLNIGGRVCLLFGVFWGVLALVWAMFLQPGFDKLIAKIPNTIGKPATWIFCVFFIFNIAVSAVAVNRWQQRMEGISATTAFSMVLDQFFPDSLMEHNFGEMVAMEHVQGA